MKDLIVQTGALVLRQKAAPVLKEEFGSKALLATIKKMEKALAKEKFGVAIAAPQIGVSKRIFVVADKAFEKDAEEIKEKHSAIKKIFINPEIIRLSKKKKEMAEGCLSVRGKYGSVLRHEKASVRAQDIDGTQFTYQGSGLLAHIFQHECDHLDGILYTDKASQLRDDQAI